MMLLMTMDEDRSDDIDCADDHPPPSRAIKVAMIALEPGFPSGGVRTLWPA
jgi:hypothetical protein